MTIQDIRNTFTPDTEFKLVCTHNDITHIFEITNRLFGIAAFTSMSVIKARARDHAVIIETDMPYEVFQAYNEVSREV